MSKTRIYGCALGVARAAVISGLVVVPCLSGRALAASSDYSLNLFQSDFGGVGLMQTPTARMKPTAQMSFTYDQVDPYTHYAFSLQPFEWLEAGFRYTQISDRLYPASGQRELEYLDKGVDLKLSLIDESRYVPEVALGFRDFGGTGLFGSEYVVANKRWYNFDFSLGLAWGYLGSRADLENPLRVAGERFEERTGRSADGGGDFNLNQLFTGKAALFGGIQYQTPFEPLTLQLEYDGNDYSSEPLDNPQEQDSPINVGARLRVHDNVTLSAAWERGNTAMFGMTLSANLAGLSQPKNDPAPVPPKPGRDHNTNDWSEVADALADNAGIRASRITRDGNALVVEGVAAKYRRMPEAEMRANRILHNAAGPDIDTFRYRWISNGFHLREDVMPRDPLPHAPILVEPGSAFADLDYRRGVAAVNTVGEPASSSQEQALYESFGDRFSWSLWPDVNQNYGGPDGYLYQVLAKLGAQFRTDEHGWFSGSLGYTLLDNLDNADYIAPSDLPRVRTFVTRYLDETEVGIYNLQYTRTARLSDNWFGMAYGGYLEQMYAGAGGEVLYRPFNSDIAFGFNANWVRQREFDTQFGLRDYSTWTGHATAYVDTGIKDVLAQLSVGRYLAKDIGATLDFSRLFDNGVRLGAYATFTDAGDAYGEGSFDKGIYLSMPLDLFFTESSSQRAGIAWRPLTRDGGARLSRRYSLYGLTSLRNLGNYWEDFQ